MKHQHRTAAAWAAVSASCSSGPTSTGCRAAEPVDRGRRLGRIRRRVPIPEGSYFAELPVDSITPNPRQPRTVFDEDAMAELVDSIDEVGLLQPVVVRPLGDGQFELVMGERRWRAAQAAGLDDDSGDRPGDRGPRPAARRAAGEPAPGAAQPAGGGGGVPADAGGLRLHPGGAGDPDQAVPAPDLQHHPAAPAAADRAAAGGRRRAQCRHARALLALEDPAAQERLAQRVVAEGLSVRAIEEIVALGETAHRGRPGAGRGTHGPRAGGRGLAAAARRTTWTLGCGSSWAGAEGRITIDFAQRRGSRSGSPTLD